MMKQVKRYKLSPSTTEIELPNGSQVLSVGAYLEHPCVWILETDEVPRMNYCFRCYADYESTGFTAYPNFVGTIVMPNGYVYHVFTNAEVRK